MLEGRAVAVRVQWDQTQADAQAALDKAQERTVDGSQQQAPPAGAVSVFEVDTRIWKEDSGPIPPRSVDQQVYKQHLYICQRVLLKNNMFTLFSYHSIWQRPASTRTSSGKLPSRWTMVLVP